MLYTPPPGETVCDVMADLADRLDLSCVALNPGCRDLLSGVAFKCKRIEEIDLFGVGARIESRRLVGFSGRWAERFPGRRLHFAAVNGPYRIPLPEDAVLVLHLTIWPVKWLTRVCPFVVNGFREAKVFVGEAPRSLVERREPEPRELLEWHYGLSNCLRYIRQGNFEAPTWWIDGRPGSGSMAAHDISGPYRMTEFISYTLNSFFCNLEDFPFLSPAAADRARSMAAEFRHQAVSARNGAPVDAAWLAHRRPEAMSLIEQLIAEMEPCL